MLALAYAICFGVELTTNNVVSLYLFNHFKLSLTTSGILGESTVWGTTQRVAVGFHISRQPDLAGCQGWFISYGDVTYPAACRGQWSALRVPELQESFA